MPQVTPRQQGGVISYYASKNDAINKTNSFGVGFSRTIGDMLDGGSLQGITQWKIYSYTSFAAGMQYTTNSDIIYTTGETLPVYDGNGTEYQNYLIYVLYPANSGCCPDSTQRIGLSYDVRNDVRAGSIFSQMPPNRFSSYSAYYQMRMAKSARK